nr:uncharacterized protein LOC123774882 isoform X1 [Procambarus clarkii]
MPTDTLPSVRDRQTDSASPVCGRQTEKHTPCTTHGSKMMENSRRLAALMLVLATVTAGARHGDTPGYSDNAMVYLAGDGEVIIVKAGGDSEGRGWSNRGIINVGRFVHSPVAEASFCTVDQNNCILEEISCSSDDNCWAALPMLQLAMDLGKDSSIPSRPFCTTDTAMSNHSGEHTGTCSCGRGRCVSYSKQFGRNTKFFYCGPCGYMGSECRNRSCTHEMGECLGNYCECSGNGVFYEFSFCTLPYKGYETALQIAIILCIAIATCLLIASLYTVLIGRRLRRIPERLRGLRERDINEGPVNDTPPTYEEVADKLPTYQDALRLAQESDPDGVHNLGFEDEDHLDLPSQLAQQDGRDREDGEMNGEIVSRAMENDNLSHCRSIRREVTIAEVHEGVGGMGRSDFEEATQVMASDSSEIRQSTVAPKTRLSVRESSEDYQSTVTPSTHASSSDSLEVHESPTIHPIPFRSSEVHESVIRPKTDFQPIETSLQNALEAPIHS